MNNNLTVFGNFKIRRVYDEKADTWYFSVVDIVQALLQQPDFQTARKYWNKLKERLKKEGSQVVTNCHQLKMVAPDGKMRLTDAANPETLLRLIQSVPSPKAEPIKLWLAKVGYERMQEMADPSLSFALKYKCLMRELAKRSDNRLDKAQFASVIHHKSISPMEGSRSDTGGIDLNPAQMSMQVKGQGDNFKFEVNGQIFDAAQITSVTFTIRHMSRPAQAAPNQPRQRARGQGKGQDAL